LNVTEGKLTNINVLKVVLDKMSMIPDLVDKVEKNLPEKYKKKLQDKDTPIERVEIDATVKNGSLVVTDAQVTSDTFLLTGKGTIGFDQTVALDTSLAIPEDLSTSMVTSADNLKFLLDRKGQIMIPVKVSGKVSSPRFFPDLEYLGKRIIATRGREELNKFLDKVLDKDAEGGQAAPAQDAQGQPAQQPAQPQQEEESSEKELIDNILDSIFN